MPHIPNHNETVDSDPAFQREQSRIGGQFDALADERRKYNLSVEAGTTVEGLVSGRGRYAQNVQSGIMTGVVNEGLAAIQKIIFAKDSALAAARDAAELKNAEKLAVAMKEKAAAEKAAKDEVRKLKEDSYKAKDEDRKTADDLASSIYSVLSGNPDEDMETIKSIADSKNIDFSLLLNSIDKHKALVKDRENKGLPSLVREYEYAREKGFFNGSFMEYQSLRSSINRAPPKSRVLNKKTSVRIGLPELAGISEDELIDDLINPNPSRWFLEKYYNNNPDEISTNQTKIIAEWNKLRNSTEVSNYTKGINTSISSWTDLIRNLPDLSDYNPSDEE